MTDEPIVLRVATGDSGAGLKPHQEIIARFEVNNPSIKVELESVEGRDYYGRLLTDLAAGTGPDILQIGDDALPKFVDQDVLVPLDVYMNGNYPLDTNIYIPGLLQPGQWRNAQYLLPKDYSTLAIFYNKKLFDAYDIPYPSQNWTWTEFLDTAKALTKDTDGDGQTDTWGVQLPASWTTGFEYWIAAAGGQAISGDGQAIQGYLDSPEVVEAIQFYSDLYHKHAVAPLPKDLNAFGGGNDEFEQGQAAMRLFGRWPQADLLENEAISLGVSVLPQHAQKANILIWGGFGIAKSSQHQEAAWRFLRFYTGEEGAEIWQNWALPAVQSVANNAGVIEDPIEGVWLNQLKYTRPRSYTL